MFSYLYFSLLLQKYVGYKSNNFLVYSLLIYLDYV